MAVNSVLHVLSGAGYGFLWSTVPVARRAIVVVNVPPVIGIPGWQKPDIAFFSCHTLKGMKMKFNFYLY